MSWDKITAEDASWLRSHFPGLRPALGALEVGDSRINYIEVNQDRSIGVGWVDKCPDPEIDELIGVYSLQKLQVALEYAEDCGAQAVHLIEGPRQPGRLPTLVLLCEDEDGYVGRRCVLVAPQDPEAGQQEVV